MVDRGIKTVLTISFIFLTTGWIGMMHHFIRPPTTIMNPKDSIICTLDYEMLSSIINAEAGPNTLDTISCYLIGSTVLNRVKHIEFPSTIEEVIKDENQYDGYMHKNYYRTDLSDSIALALMLGHNHNKNVLFFCRKHINLDIHKKYRVIFVGKDHKFYGL